MRNGVFGTWGYLTLLPNISGTKWCIHLKLAGFITHIYPWVWCKDGMYRQKLSTSSGVPLLEKWCTKMYNIENSAPKNISSYRKITRWAIAFSFCVQQVKILYYTNMKRISFICTVTLKVWDPNFSQSGPGERCIFIRKHGDLHETRYRSKFQWTQWGFLLIC